MPPEPSWSPLGRSSWRCRPACWCDVVATGDTAGPERSHPVRMVTAMSRRRTVHRCTACGGMTLRWAGRCASCGEWNTLVEELEETRVGRDGSLSGQPGGHAGGATGPADDDA